MKRIIVAIILVLSLAAAQTSFAAGGSRSPATSYVAAPTPTPMAGIQKHG